MKFTRILQLFFFLILCAGNALAQESACATKPTEEEREKYMAELRLMNSVSSRAYEDNTLKVIMYRLREDDGSGALSDSAFAEEINNLNSFYSGHGICFSLMRIVNIDHSPYLNGAVWSDPDRIDSMKSVIATENPWFADAMTIYVLPPSVWYRGSSYGIPSTALIMTSNSTLGPLKWGTAHIAHEMGHCLGNFHTHDDTDGSRLEIVDRFCPLFPPLPNDQGLWWDCCAGADGLCSTPSDPRLSGMTSYGIAKVNAMTCQYQDTVATDIFGNLFTPDVSNIMSYAPVSCRNSFSWEQENRHHLTLDLNLDFASVQAPLDYTFGDALYNTNYAHIMAKNSITIAPGNAYTVEGDAQIMHEVEGFIDLKPGFEAAPTSTQGYFRARAKNLCENDPDLSYAMSN